MDSLEAWAFNDATSHTTGDGKHTFYRVTGSPVDRDIAQAWGVFVNHVTGEGMTPEEALQRAMAAAITEMKTARDRRWAVNAAVLRRGI